MAPKGAAISFSRDSIYMLFISIFCFFSLTQFFNNEIKTCELELHFKFISPQDFPMQISIACSLGAIPQPK